jgi:putative transposase
LLSPIETDADLLACCRDGELDPVRARMTETPASCPWSRYRRHAGAGVAFAWLDVDPCCAALGSTAEARATDVLQWTLQEALEQKRHRLVRQALRLGRDRALRRRVTQEPLDSENPRASSGLLLQKSRKP